MTSSKVPSNKIMTEPAQEMKLGYARVSTLNEAQETSIETQQQMLKGCDCDEIFVEKISGGSLDRPELQKLVNYVKKAAKSQSVEVIFSNAYRLSRGELVTLADELEPLGVTLTSLQDGPVSTKTAVDRMRWGFMDVMGEFYIRSTREKVLAAKEHHRKIGHRMGGKNPLGYRWSDDNSRLERDPEVWPIAREIIERYLNGQGLPSLCRWLREERGIERTANGILRWLKSDVIRGHRRHRIINGQKADQVFYDTHERLITPSEEKALELRFQNNKRYSGGRKIRAVSGLCRCKSCKILLSLCDDKRPRKDGRKYFSFRCKVSRIKGEKCRHKGIIPYEKVEPVVLDAICKRADDIAAAALEPEEETEDPRVLQLQSQLLQLQKVNKANPLDTIETAMNDIHQQIAYLQSSKGQRQADQQHLDELTQAVAQPHFWDGLGEEDRNQIYREMKVVVWCEGREIVEVEIGG